ncbi:MAG: pyruvate formate lyase family protein, partial [Myxococcaceae bacterium]
VKAFSAQVVDAAHDMTRLLGWLEEVYRVHRPTPVNSMITEGCLARGRDVTWGGADYDFTSIQCAGLADAGDSLYALKRLVFDEKRLSLGELAKILEADFAGHDALRAELQQRFARYGNGESGADRMTQLAADTFTSAITAHRNGRGGRYLAGFYSMTCNHGFGSRTGALPNGRRAGARLSNGLSPADGVERKGPSAVLRSAASLDTRHFGNCAALNLKFEKSMVKGRTGRSALVSLFKNYFDGGGMQVQVNVLDAEELRAAKADPSAHPGIVVRVAGYCAYFADLQPCVQDEIIERTAHGLG